jgi:hypothetical protein
MPLFLGYVVRTSSRSISPRRMSPRTHSLVFLTLKKKKKKNKQKKKKKKRRRTTRNGAVKTQKLVFFRVLKVVLK